MAYSQLFVQLLCGVIFLTTSVYTAPLDNHDDVTKIDLFMPDVQPQVVETYLCYPIKVDKTMYITGFQPKASMKTAHHILIYGCSTPGSSGSVWNCGEMHTVSSNYPSAPVCGGEESKIIYAWAMDAPELHLPEGVAFKVGEGTDIQYLTLQVHYKDVSLFVPPNNGKDNSGVVLLTTETPQPKRAGVYLMGTFGEIPPQSTVYMETACSYNEPLVLHPFAFRTHAHTHGKVVAGYRVRGSSWTEIGRKSPQLPQMFYNVTNPGMTVEPGDTLAARCTMVNDENRTIEIGATGNDEMCNFYMMYYVNGDSITKDNYCFSPGPPKWNWFNMEGLNALEAPEEASIIPGTTDFIKSSVKMMENMKNYMDEQEERVDEDLRKMLESLQESSNYDDAAAAAAAAADDTPNEKRRWEDAEENDEMYPYPYPGRDEEQVVENLDDI